jgi:site-specific recombinase XerD
MKEKTDISLATLLQNFFCQRLMLQRGASPQTIASYRDTFCLLFCYAKETKKKEPASLVLSDINADFILEFLNYLETKRENCQRT